jgi:hypothetical protein
MKLFKRVIAVGTLLAISSNVMAEAPSFGADIGFESNYMFRGVSYSAEKPVFQSDVWVGWEDLSLSVWTNVDITNELGQRADFNEVDVSADYVHEFDAVIFGVGLAYFTYPLDSSASTGTEAYVSGSSNLDVFNFGASAYYDLVNSALYLTPEVSIGYTFADLITPTLSATLGLGGTNFTSYTYEIDKYFGFNDLTSSLAVEVGLPGDIGEILYFTAHVSYATLLNDEVIDVVESDDWSDLGAGSQGNFWAGLMVSAEF